MTGIPPISIGIGLADAAQRDLLPHLVMLGARDAAGRNLLDSRAGPRDPRLRGGGGMVGEPRRRHLPDAACGLRPRRRCSPALAGWLYAHMQRFVSPAPFDIKPGIEYLLMAVVGGAGHIAGAVVGAASITLLKNWLQDVLPLVTRTARNSKSSCSAFCLILLLQKARGGIVPLIASACPRARAAAARAPPSRCRAARCRTGTTASEGRGCRARRFGGLVAVNEVSFELKAGEILGLIGPNGAGKSTMFNLITGALQADAGADHVPAATTITQSPPTADRAQGHRAHVPAREAAAEHDAARQRRARRLSAHRDRLPAGALRLDRAEETADAAEALRQLQRVGLGDNSCELAGNLPLGQQRILEVARALAADPVLVMLDEPAAGLRLPREAGAGRAVAPALRADGMTILLVEHDMDFVMSLVDRLVVMDFGAKLAEGCRPRSSADPRVQEAYLGGVAMTALLEVKDLSCRYGKVEAVNGVSLSLQEGQIVTVIGPNGAGKTTLLAALMGLLPSQRRGSLSSGEVSAQARRRGARRRGICWCRRRASCSPR